MTDEGTPMQCIALRLRRTTHEDAYVNVPVTDTIVKLKPDGKYGIDFEAFVAEGIRLSQANEVEWKVEEVVSECHPIQQPKPDDRRAFDVHYGPESGADDQGARTS
jgi:hypothetical protein